MPGRQAGSTGASWPKRSFERALDVGCGTGALLGLLERPNAKLAGADLSGKMIAEAKSKLGDAVDLRVADAESRFNVPDNACKSPQRRWERMR